MTDKATQALLSMSEKSLSQHVVHAAKECGWLVARTWLSKFSPAGEPDLRMVKDGRLVIAELKSDKGQPSAAQVTWLDALSQVQGIETFLLRPNDLGEVYKLLLGQEHNLKQWRQHP